MHRKTFSALAMASAPAAAAGPVSPIPDPPRRPYRRVDGSEAAFPFEGVGDKTRGYGSGRSQAKRRKIARRRGLCR